MISRFLLAVGVAILMVVTGTTSYVYVSGRHSKVAAPPQKPTAATPRAQAFVLPGTLYLAQSGALYSMSVGRFHQLTPEDGWTMPALYPDGHYLVAVNRGPVTSDVWALTLYGAPVNHMVNNAAPGGYTDTSGSHWAFYPRLSLDERTLFMSYDEPKYGYDVIMSVWEVPVTAGAPRGLQWTQANDYTGGDVQPIPLKTGGIMYTKYEYGPDAKLVGQLWFSARPESSRYGGAALTPPDEDCREPSLSPDGREVAMICTYEKQVSYLTIASWDGSNLGPRQTVITDQMVAQPIWAPDGSGIAYFAPGAPDGPFQLWFLPRNAYHPPAPSPIPTPTPTPGGPYTGKLPSPSPVVAPPPPVVKPIQITTNLGFDASSPMTWAG